MTGSSAPDPQGIDRLDAAILAQVEAIMTAAGIPGASIAVIADGQSYHHAYGVKSVQTGARVTLDTAFNIGSCSKAFSSATIAALVAKGLCAWDDPVTRWVPEFQLYDPAITALASLRDLAANRLGLPGAGLTESGFDPSFPAEHIFERLRHTPPAFPFRGGFGYVNAGHAANAVAAGRITGKGFLPTLREHILTPLGMTGTSGGAVALNELADVAGWHVVINDAAQAIDPVATDQYLGSGGMVVSGRDALQWLRLHLGGGVVDGHEIIAQNALRETHRPHSIAKPEQGPISLFYPKALMAAYALGWAVSDVEGHRLVMHSGSDLGVQAHTLLLPDRGIGIAVYGNGIGGGPGTLALAFAIAGQLLGLAPRDWFDWFESLRPKPPLADPVTATAISETDLALYRGTYEHPADGPLDIVLKGGKLVGVLRHAYRLGFDLTPVGEHRFVMALSAPEWRGVAAGERFAMSFAVDGGRAIRAEMSGPFQGRPFERTGG
jgi:CubicO group peptidase (beta-lactamase class C family)